MRNKPEEEKTPGHDGATLDVSVDTNEELPHGLARLPGGMIAVTKLYCPNGHNLIDESSAARFNQFPGIVLMVEGEETKGEVVLSPIHGDDTKFGEANFEPGEVTKITCPTCGVALPGVQPCGCVDGAELVAVYLDKEKTEGNQLVLCNSWGCLRSRVLDRFQIISRYE